MRTTGFQLSQAEARPQVSVVVPLYDEAESLPALVALIREAFQGLGTSSWELLLVDDGSRDDTEAVARSLCAEDDRVRILTFARNFGQSQALQAGFDNASGSVVITMDGDLQNDPADFGSLLSKLAEGYDVVVGYREFRADPYLSRRVPSRIANALMRALTGVQVRDTGCTLKAFRREIVEKMFLYADHHRFIPVLAAAGCGARIAEVPVRHHPRRFGVSKYGIGRVPRVLADMLILKAIMSFHDRPLALFGAGGLGALAVSTGFAAAAITSFFSAAEVGRGAVVFPGVALLFLALGCHLFLLGILAEVVVRQRMPSTGRDHSAREVRP